MENAGDAVVLGAKNGLLPEAKPEQFTMTATGIPTQMSVRENHAEIHQVFLPSWNITLSPWAS